MAVDRREPSWRKREGTQVFPQAETDFRYIYIYVYKGFGLGDQ